MRYRIYVFILLLVCGISLPALSGLLIFPFSMIPSQLTLAYSIILSSVLLSISLLLRRSKSGKGYWQISFAFFVASLAIFFDLLVNVPSNTMSGLTLDMLISTSIILTTIVLLTKVSGNTLGSIFLKKANLKLSLAVGLTGFSIFAILSILAAQYLFHAHNLTLGRVIGWMPWILPTVLLNGVREETLYRGLFLKKLDPKLGTRPSNLLQATIFSLSHSVAGVGLTAYTPYVWALMIFTFSLGFVWGYIMQRTGSILGSTLFHAGTDIPVFIGIFSNTF